MKSKRKKRILAAILCMVMVLTNNISILAEDMGMLNTETPVGTEVTKQETEQPEVEEPEQKPEEPEQKPEEPEQKPEELERKPEEPEQKPEQPEQKPEQPEQKPEAPEEPEQETEAPEEEKPVLSEEVELKKEFCDADGKLVQKITAKLPKGAFEAETSAITMEVEKVKGSSEDYMKKLMTESLSEEKELGDYFLYKIEFKVNGKKMESLEPIEITFAKSDFEIKDVKDVNVFYFEPKDPQAGRNEDEIIEIVQRKELVKNLQAAGKSTADLDEKYDVSSVEVKENQRTGKIVLEGRKSTIYGCYVEKEPEKEAPEEETENPEEAPIEVPGFTYEDDEVVVKVTAEEEGVIPEGAELKVLPITSDQDTKAQYEEVEKKIQDKVAEEEKEVAGFLAYDISFADKDGNELEPNGKVKVSMNYKKAEIPKEVVEQEVKDAEVTVFHLEEDEKGEVKDVVDMGAKKTAKVDTLITTEGQKVQNVEAETEGFSVFTITWTKPTTDKKAVLHYVIDNGTKYGRDISGSLNNAGGELTFNGSENLGDAQTSLNNLGQKAETPPGSTVNSGYRFKSAHLDSVNGTVTDNISYNEKWWYINSEGAWAEWTSWQDGESRGNNTADIYLVYEKVNKNGVTKKTTIDTQKEKIKINLFNYNERINESSLAKNDSFYFYNGGLGVIGVDGKSPWTGDTKYTEPGDQQVHQDYLKSNLKNGYPVLENGTSLSPLFTAGGTGVTAYPNLNGLLYDQNGYYVYDSSEHHAQLEGNEIAVYNAKLSPDWNTFGYGNFLPFNRFPYGAADGTGNSVHRGKEKTDMWYGMNIGFSFVQPKNGYVDSKAMEFKFRGDDDVWVFIDGVKVLDLGGIHDKKEGSINFRTGQIQDGVKNPTLADMYKAAYKEKNPSASYVEVERYLSSIFEKVNGQYTRFKNYSAHTFEFFYLERGAGAANCKIEFNMPTIPPNSVMVTKEVETMAGVSSDYASDIDYKFNIQSPTQPNKKVWSYDLYVNNNPVGGEKQTDENGNFTLKHGQTAVFQGFVDTDKYIVKELGASLGEGYEVSIDGVEVETKDESGQTTSKIQSATTGERTVYITPSAVFTNKVKDTGTLTLKKEFAENTEGDNTKDFVFVLKVNDELYKGSYSLNGEAQPETQNGNIILKAGDKVTITGFPYGTRFEVYEELDGSYLPTYSVSGELYGCQIPNDDNAYTSVSGEIAGDGTVTVTNRKVNVDFGVTKVTIKKTWDQSALYEQYIPESIDVELYKDTSPEGSENHGKWDKKDELVIQDASGNPLTARVTLQKRVDWTHTWSNLPGDTDYVVREYYPEGFKWKTTEYVNHLSNFEYIDRLTSCKSKDFNLGRNNMLLVKKGNDCYIWTVYDLGLTESDLVDIKEALDQMKLPGLGDIGTLKYDHGIQEDDDGITLNPTDSGWHLKFEKTSVWSQFWCLSYDRTEEIKLTNTIAGEYKTNITVNKVWDVYDEIPENIQVQLKQDGKPYERPVIITEDSGWTHTWNGLPYYWVDGDGKYHVYEYTVEETQVGGILLEETNYKVTYSSMTNNVITITNEYVKPWRVLKISSSSTTENMIYLKDAWFELTNQETEKKLYGRTDSLGLLEWYEDEEHKVTYDKTIPNGTYLLEETKAPSGYSKSLEDWNVRIENGQLEVTRRNTTTFQDEEVPRYEDETQITYYYENTPLYDLPSTGGNGIFQYIISGTLLMMAAGILMLYKMKRKGVLES